ncbi:BnaA02g16810D [Brassica napus]|uniref:(rape) hypothetical protein n=1 Tax=Brassica napus TaxID=3708 RepID=A0A078IE64_BRANA|nr:unnamed protein product [Brassica napus]CDY49125.1 BnaA02g16810D [Brassica napus]
MLPCQLKILNQTYVEITLHTYSSYIKEYIWSKELTLIIYRCMHTSTGMNTSTYTLNFSDKTHTRNMSTRSMRLIDGLFTAVHW